MKYIHQNQILDIEIFKNSGYQTSDNIEDRFEALIPLNEAQEAFSEQNKNASVMEIWNCKLNEVIVVTPIENSLLRSQAYRMESDELFRIYLIYKDLEKTPEEIEAARLAWITKRDEIKVMYP